MGGTLSSTPYGRWPWKPKAATECTKVAYNFRKTAYLEEYSSTAWTSHDYSIATPSTAVMPSTAVPSGASPSATLAWAPTSPTTSLIEYSKVKESKFSKEIENVSKSLPENSKSDGRPKR
ncbi:hypothetical protein FF1_037892 [Malus domestica]